jgi:hypothetical protein
VKIRLRIGRKEAGKRVRSRKKMNLPSKKLANNNNKKNHLEIIC